MRLAPEEWIGKEVNVVMDRPLGTYHPEKPDMFYTVNYGYLPGTMADDGEEIDAYVLGIDVPVEKFDGKVIAIVARSNDVEDKLVVTNGDRSFTADEIMKQIEFQEKYWDSSVVTEKS
jgi:inorganic pyrophosphatase